MFSVVPAGGVEEEHRDPETEATSSSQTDPTTKGEPQPSCLPVHASLPFMPPSLSHLSLMPPYPSCRLVDNGDYFLKLSRTLSEWRISCQMLHIEFVEIWLIKLASLGPACHCVTLSIMCSHAQRLGPLTPCLQIP